MKDQHKQIKGYRDLNQLEVDSMNNVKNLVSNLNTMAITVPVFDRNLTPEQKVQEAQCLEVAKQKLVEAEMWLVRSIALPHSSTL